MNRSHVTGDCIICQIYDQDKENNFNTVACWYRFTRHVLAEDSKAADELFDRRLLYFLTLSVTIPDVNFLLRIRTKNSFN